MHVVLALVVAVGGAWFAWKLWQQDRENRAKGAPVPADDPALVARIANLQRSAAAPPTVTVRTLKLPNDPEEARINLLIARHLGITASEAYALDAEQWTKLALALDVAAPPAPAARRSKRRAPPSVDDEGAALDGAIADRFGMTLRSVRALDPSVWIELATQVLGKAGKGTAGLPSGARPPSARMGARRTRHARTANARIVYMDLDGEETERDITALQFRETGIDNHGDAIIAWCHLRKSQRTFLIEGILALTDLETGEVLHDEAAVLEWARSRGR